MNSGPVRILVIDGDSASRNYLTTMLQKNGYEVMVASLGREGLISAWKDTPALVVLDPFLPDMSGRDLVERLRQDRRTASVPIAALASKNDPQVRAEVLAAGCNEYLVKSNQAMQALLDLFPSWLKGETEPIKEGKLIVFLSAKGGTGTSSLCANLAMCVAGAIQGKLAVMDLVLPIGSIADIVGYKEQLNLVAVAKLASSQTNPSFFKNNLPHIASWNFYLLAGSQDPESASQLPGERVEELLKSVIQAYEIVFVDLGRSLSRISMPIIHQADIIVLVLGTDMANATLTNTVWEYLKNQGVDPARVYAINNRAVGLEGLTRAEMEKTIGLPIHVTMPYNGENLTVANNRHEPFSLRFPNDSGTLILKQSTQEIIEMIEKARRY